MTTATKLIKTPVAKAVAKPATKPAAAAPAKVAKKVVAKPEVEETSLVAEPEVQEEVAAEATVESADTTEASGLSDQIGSVASEIESLKEEKAFKMVPTLLDDIDRNFFRLGGILSRINSEGWFMDKGHENFRAYIEAETDVGYRKAMYLIGIYNGLVTSGVTWDQVKHLGWTKLKDLAPHLTAENVEEWVQMVDGLTTLQIQELIKQKTAGVKSGESPESEANTAPTSTTTMTFKVHADQKETIREALDKAKHEVGTTVDTVALEHIALNYLGGDSVIKTPSFKDVVAGKSVVEVLEMVAELYPDAKIEVSVD